MALSNYDSSKIFLSVSDGSLVRSFKSPNANTQERVNKKGNTVHEQKFRDISGTLTAIGKREHDYGVDLQLTMQDGEEQYQISMPFSSRYTTSFLKALPNIDISKPIKLMPWSMVDKNDATKKITGITCYQGEKIAPYYTKEDPKGLPQMQQVKLKGKVTWDDTDMMDFLFGEAVKQLQVTAWDTNIDDKNNSPI